MAASRYRYLGKSGACCRLETIAAAHCRYFEMQSRVLRQPAPLDQRFRSLLAGENLGQHLPVRLVVFTKVSTDAALTVVDCDHVGSLRVGCDAQIVFPGCTPDPVLIAYKSLPLK